MSLLPPTFESLLEDDERPDYVATTSRTSPKVSFHIERSFQNRDDKWHDKMAAVKVIEPRVQYHTSPGGVSHKSFTRTVEETNMSLCKAADAAALRRSSMMEGSSSSVTHTDNNSDLGTSSVGDKYTSVSRPLSDSNSNTNSNTNSNSNTNTNRSSDRVVKYIPSPTAPPKSLTPTVRHTASRILSPNDHNTDRGVVPSYLTDYSSSSNLQESTIFNTTPLSYRRNNGGHHAPSASYPYPSYNLPQSADPPIKQYSTKVIHPEDYNIGGHHISYKEGINTSGTQHCNQQGIIMERHYGQYPSVATTTLPRCPGAGSLSGISRLHSEGATVDSEGHLVLPKHKRRPFATHYDTGVIYSSMTPPEATGLMDRYGFHYAGQGDRSLAEYEKYLIKRAERLKNILHKEEMDKLLEEKEKRKKQLLIDNNKRDMNSYTGLQGFGNDEEKRKAKSRADRKRLEEQWLIDMKREKPKKELPDEENWNTIEAQARAREEEEALRRLQAENEAKQWNYDESQRKRQEMSMYEAEPIPFITADFSDRILLAEEQRRRAQEEYKEQLDQQIREKHAMNMQRAAQQYALECRLKTY